jgi:mRNA interferase HigB
MRILSRSTLRDFWERHGDAKRPLSAWFAEARKAMWREPADVLNQFGNARVIGNDRVVFNIKGNDYRLVVAIRYDKGLVFIRFVGTHAEYDKIDAGTS